MVSWWQDKAVLVLGGQGFLGRALCQDLESLGSRAIPIDRADAAFSVDLLDPRALDTVITELFEEEPKVGGLGLVVASGHSVFSPSSARTVEEIEQVLMTNLAVPILALNTLAAWSKATGIESTAVVIGSIFGSRVPTFSNYQFSERRNSEVYGASKAGVEQLVRYYGQLLGREGVRVNAVAPGGIYDSSVHTADFVKSYGNDTALGRMSDLNEVVDAIRFMLGPDSRGIVGQTLSVDCGFKL